MTDIDRNLLPDEKITFRTKKHMIIFFLPAIWTLFCFYASFYMVEDAILVRVVWVPWVMAAIFWLYVWIEYSFSEFAVTTKRVMMREGFFNKHTTELRISAIAQVNIDQGIFGQLFNFGTITINSFGVGDTYTLIAKAVRFQQAVNLELDKLLTKSGQA